jgi:hypothetical protein
MKPTPENTEPSLLVGYLGADDVLYCSRACASARGQTNAAPVDQGQYQALLERGTTRGQLVCPVCGAEFPLDWSEEGDRL